MNVFLINCPIRENVKPNIVPTGLGQIVNVLKQTGHNVTVLDINGLRYDKNEVRYIIKQNIGIFDLIGISGMITTYNYQKWLIRLIKEYTDKPIVCGGGCATFSGDLLMKLGVDIIEGEGENEILNYITGDKEDSRLRYKTINDFPFPDWDSFPMEKYLINPIWGNGTGNTSNVGIHPDMKQERSVNIITSRGCPYNCNFCKDLFGREYRQRSVENVIAEVKELKQRYNIDFIGFVDDNMLVSRPWAVEFSKEIGKIGVLWGCHARVNEVDEELLKTAFNGGCRWIGYGIESGSQTILDNMNKKVKINQAKQAIELTRKYNIYPNTSFMYGYPGENKDTVNETIRFCKELNLKPNFFYTTPYPGTKLFEENKDKIANKYGTMDNFVKSLGEAKDFSINLTSMKDDEYFDLKHYLERELN